MMENRGGIMKAQSVETVVEDDAGRLEDLLGYHLRRASMLDMNDFVTHFADVPLRPVPFSVLCVIGEQPGVTAAEICRQLQLQRANIVALLAEIEAGGLIERRADDGDQRIQRLALTATGRDSLAVWRRRVRQREERLFHRLTPAERAALRRLLAKVWQAGDP